MERRLRKPIISCLFAGLVSLGMPFAPIVRAEEVTASNRISAPLIADTNGTMQKSDMRTRMQAILHPKTENLSTIPKDHAYIPKDTILTVELTEEISSKTMKKGMYVPLKLQDNIIVNDVVVVPAGAEVEGIVTNVRKNGFFGRSGKLEFTITSVKAINGVRIPLQYVTEKKAGADGGAVAVAVVASLLGGFLMKGKNVSFPKGSLFEARVTADTDLNTTLDGLADAMSMDVPHGTTITIK